MHPKDNIILIFFWGGGLGEVVGSDKESKDIKLEVMPLLKEMLRLHKHVRQKLKKR